jgi:hypothetical protein
VEGYDMKKVLGYKRETKGETKGKASTGPLNSLKYLGQRLLDFWDNAGHMVGTMPVKELMV